VIDRAMLGKKLEERLEKRLEERLKEKPTEKLIDKLIEDRFIEYLSELVKQLKIASNDPDVWDMAVVDVDTPTVVRAREKLTIVNSLESGRLVAVAITTTDRNTLIEFEIDTSLMRITPRELYNDGLVGYNSAYPWLSKYDDTDNKYMVWFTPVPERIYHSKIRVEVTPTTSASVTYSCYRYKLKR